MNVFDSTMGRIHVCLLCCLLVTIRGLVGPFTLTIDTETLGLSITGEKYTVVSRQHMVTCSCSPSLPLCSIVDVSSLMSCFFLKKKQVLNRKNVKISSNHWELKINKDCENSQSL
jgi:hypothetical protein